MCYRINIPYELTLNVMSPGFFALAHDVLEDVIHRLEGPSACFRYKIESPYQRQEAEHSEESIGAEACVLY